MLKPTLEPAGLSGAPDEALMKKISQHQQPALNELYGRYGQTLKAVIDSVVHEGAEADDVLQEIFLQIWKEAKFLWRSPSPCSRRACSSLASAARNSNKPRERSRFF